MTILRALIAGLIAVAASGAFAQDDFAARLALARRHVPKGTPEEIASIAAERAAMRIDGKGRRARVAGIVDERLPYPPKVGDVGWFWSSGARIFSIMGPSRMLLESRPDSLNGDSALCILEVPTAGLVDDTGYKTEGHYRVTKTERYATAAGGTNTVFVLKPVAATEAEIERVVRLIVAGVNWDKEKRTWTDKAGKEIAVGVFVELVGEKVSILEKDGAVRELAIGDLSTANQRFVRAQERPRRP